MAVSIKKKNSIKSKTKSRKHFNKSRKNVQRTVKMRGGKFGTMIRRLFKRKNKIPNVEIKKKNRHITPNPNYLHIKPKPVDQGYMDLVNTNILHSKPNNKSVNKSHYNNISYQRFIETGRLPNSNKKNISNIVVNQYEEPIPVSYLDLNSIVEGSPHKKNTKRPSSIYGFPDKVNSPVISTDVNSRYNPLYLLNNVKKGEVSEVKTYGEFWKKQGRKNPRSPIITNSLLRRVRAKEKEEQEKAAKNAERIAEQIAEQKEQIVLQTPERQPHFTNANE